MLHNFFLHLGSLLFSSFLFWRGYFLIGDSKSRYELKFINDFLSTEEQNIIIGAFVILSSFLILFAQKVKIICILLPLLSIFVCVHLELEQEENLNIYHIFDFLSLSAILMIIFAEKPFNNFKSPKISKEFIKEIKKNIEFMHLNREKVKYEDIVSGNF